MTNNIKQSLQSAIEEIENHGKFLSAVGILIDANKSQKIIEQCTAALSELENAEPVLKLGRWQIDKSTGKDILTLDNCSVIEGKYAHYIMGLLQKEIDKVVSELESASPQPRECEPVAEAIRERDRLGFAVVNVIGKLDEIIENTQEVEVDDFLHIAVPVDMWNELQAELEYMPKRADLYTSPQPREWVELTNADINELKKLDGANRERTATEMAFAVQAKLKQLNTKG